MEAKDTVMSPKKLQLLGQQYEDDVPTCDFTHYALEKQAEISFKAGIREVVEFMMGKKPVSHTYLDRHNREKYWFEFNVDSEEWQTN